MNDIEYEWCSQYGGPTKKKPYRECPHCGKYRFTTIRKTVTTEAKAGSEDRHWLIRLVSGRQLVRVGYRKRDICENCEYRSDYRTEVFEEYEDEVEIQKNGSVKILDKPLWAEGRRVVRLRY